MNNAFSDYKDYEVIVLGAGVSCLTCGIRLLERVSGFLKYMIGSNIDL